MNIYTKKIRFAFISVILLLTVVACSSTKSAINTSAGNERLAAPAVSTERNLLRAETQNTSAGALTDAEVEGLLFMREEEKLAGDVYRYFYNLWGNPVFQNIAQSEDMHTESVLLLLNKYSIEDPARIEPGLFSNTDLQALYHQLTTQGSQTLKDALLVAAAIEEIDLLDLMNHIAQTDNADIIRVYENLISGSENHLRAFLRVLSNQTGDMYSPQYLTQEQYDAIMQDGNGAGNGIAGSTRQGAGQGSNR